MKKGRWALWLLRGAFALLFCFSAYKLGDYVLTSRREQAAFEKLAQQVAEPMEPVEEAPPAEPDEPQMLAAYEALYQENPDLFGWLRLPGAGIDLPVMYTPQEPEFYLRRAFDGSASQSGVPFLDVSSDPEGCHYLIYGHNMKDGSMFSNLLSYGQEDFWAENKTFSFDTLYEAGEYEVLGAFYSQIYPLETEGVFRYYQYAYLEEPERFEDYVRQVKAAALYDTGVEAQPGDRLLTLSTCSYHVEDGRFVLVARRVDESKEG